MAGTLFPAVYRPTDADLVVPVSVGASHPVQSALRLTSTAIVLL
jgi:hypothetical protein